MVLFVRDRTKSRPSRFAMFELWGDFQFSQRLIVRVRGVEAWSAVFPPAMRPTRTLWAWRAFCVDLVGARLCVSVCVKKPCVSHHPLPVGACMHVASVCVSDAACGMCGVCGMVGGGTQVTMLVSLFMTGMVAVFMTVVFGWAMSYMFDSIAVFDVRRAHPPPSSPLCLNVGGIRARGHGTTHHAPPASHDRTPPPRPRRYHFHHVSNITTTPVACVALVAVGMLGMRRGAHHALPGL